MSINCPICLDPFDDEGRTPRILARCGHSICQACLKCVISRSGSAQSIMCPTCRVCHQIEANSFENSLSLFPPNFAIKHLFDVIKSTLKDEPHDEKCLCSLICFDEECVGVGVCCEACVKSEHGGCDPAKIVERDKLGSEIEIRNYGTEDAEFEDHLNTLTKEFEQDVKQISAKLVRGFIERIKEHKVEDEQLYPESDGFDIGSVKLWKNALGKSYLAPYNLEEFDGLHASLFSLRESLDKTKESLSTFCEGFLKSSFKALSKAKKRQFFGSGSSYSDEEREKSDEHRSVQPKISADELLETISLSKRNTLD